MKVEVRRASAGYFDTETYVELNTIEDVFELCKKEGDLIFEERKGELSILIYDDYIE